MSAESELLSRIRNGDIPKVSEIKKYPTETIRACLMALRKMYKASELQKLWKTSGTDLKDLYRQARIAFTRSGEVLLDDEAMEYMDSRSRSISEGIQKKKSERVQQVVVQMPMQVPTVQPDVDGFQVSIHRKYTSKTFAELIARLSLLFDKDSEEQQELEVQLTIREI